MAKIHKEVMWQESVEEKLVLYMAQEASQSGTPWSNIARHMLGLRHGLPGARLWRQVWSDHRLRGESPFTVMQMAHAASEVLPSSAAIALA